MFIINFIQKETKKILWIIFTLCFVLLKYRLRRKNVLDPYLTEPFSFPQTFHFKSRSIRFLKAQNKTPSLKGGTGLGSVRHRGWRRAAGVRGRLKTAVGILLCSASCFRDSGSNKWRLRERRRGAAVQVPHSRCLILTTCTSYF